MPQFPIHFHYYSGPFFLPERTRLKQFLLHLFAAHSLEVERINYIFCDDEYLLAINQTHLQHDTFTDIITFPYSLPSQPVVSDIYVSVERVRDNSQTYSVPFRQELLRVIFHGALHLCGIRDKTPVEQQVMRKAESDCLARFIVPRETGL